MPVRDNPVDGPYRSQPPPGHSTPGVPDNSVEADLGTRTVESILRATRAIAPEAWNILSLSDAVTGETLGDAIRASARQAINARSDIDSDFWNPALGEPFTPEEAARAAPLELPRTAELIREMTTLEIDDRVASSLEAARTTARQPYHGPSGRAFFESQLRQQQAIDSASGESVSLEMRMNANGDIHWQTLDYGRSSAEIPPTNDAYWSQFMSSTETGRTSSVLPPEFRERIDTQVPPATLWIRNVTNVTANVQNIHGFAGGYLNTVGGRTRIRPGSVLLVCSEAEATRTQREHQTISLYIFLPRGVWYYVPLTTITRIGDWHREMEAVVRYWVDMEPVDRIRQACSERLAVINANLRSPGGMPEEEQRTLRGERTVLERILLALIPVQPAPQPLEPNPIDEAITRMAEGMGIPAELICGPQVIQRFNNFVMLVAAEFHVSAQTIHRVVRNELMSNEDSGPVTTTQSITDKRQFRRIRLDRKANDNKV